MDIFKLLSRATKETRKPSTKDGKAFKLPSAGSNSNPQLFHDPTPDWIGRKRKREELDVIRQDDIEVDDEEELNFFAPKMEKRASTQRQRVLHDKAIRQNASQNEEDTVPPLLGEDECKQILRSHRLKITLLPSRDELLKKTKRSAKKRKSEEALKNKKKDEPKQIYPQPLTTFVDLENKYGISRRLGENIVAQGYRIPTEVQMGSLPLLLKPEVALCKTTDGTDILKGNDAVNLLTVAPTGSGKTLAYMIPALNSMIQQRREINHKKSHNLEVIVVAPTKELASQIVNEGRKLALGTGIKVVGMRKGMRVLDFGLHSQDGAGGNDSSEGDEEADDSGLETNETANHPSVQPTTKADILVTTPLILLHALSTDSSKEKLPLRTVRHLILDEADVLLDPLFREQTDGIWEACTNPDLHVSLWSATMGSNIEALASETIRSRADRLELEKPARIIRLVVGLKDSAIPNISHRIIYTANEPGKLLALRQLLHGASMVPLRPPFLIFTQTIPRATALHSELLYDIPPEAGGPSRIAVLHSSLSDSTRSKIMSQFRNGDIWILITTDILSRGVDFRGINGVVNYDIPTSGASYIHRVGRTGRGGRDGGVAVTFYTKEDIPHFKAIANIVATSEKAAGRTDGEGGIQKWLLDALPKPSKKEKKKLKMHGVEARRAGLSGKEGKGRAKKAQISTKSGFERRLKNNRSGAIVASMRKRSSELKDNMASGIEDTNGELSDWNGIDD